MPMQTKLIVAIIISLLVGAAGGYSVGSSSGASSVALERARQQGMAEARTQTMNEINQKFVEKGLSYPTEQEVKEVYGFVTAVAPDSFIIEYQSAQFSVLKSGMVSKKVVLAAGGTVEKIMDRPGDDAGTADDAALPGSAALGGTPPVEEEVPPAPGAGPESSPGGSVGTLRGPPPPDPTIGANLIGQEVVAIKLSELRVGDYVRVTAEADVENSETIRATAVTAFNMSHLPPGVAPDPSQLPFSRLINSPPPVVR